MKIVAKLVAVLSVATVLVIACQKSNINNEDVNSAIDNKNSSSVSAFNGTFTHPGITINKADLDKIKAEWNAGTLPRKAAFNFMASRTNANLNYSHHARATVYCDGGNSGDFTTDGDALMAMALQWYTTGDIRYAQKCVTMMNAWSSTLTTIVEGSGQYPLQDRLVTGWVGAHFAEAAEIIRYTTPANTWLDADIARYKTMLNNIFWPQVSQPAPSCDPGEPGCQFDPNAPRASNHEASYAKSQLAIAVFLDDANKFNAGLIRARSVIDKFIDASNGESNETCRDQGHTQMGLGDLVQAAEIAWKQNEDLYAHLSNRLFLGLEYTAKVLNGVSQTSHCGNQSCATCNIYPMWEMGYNHYYGRKAMSMPYSKRMVERARPLGTTKHGMFAWQTFTHAELNGTYPVTRIVEAFDVYPSPFTISGGTWSVVLDEPGIDADVEPRRYWLTSPASGAAGSGNGNLAIHNTTLPSGNFTLTANASAVNNTGSSFDDFSIIFNYQDANRYYYVSFNESNDSGTSGIFKKENGTVTQIADITSLITAGVTYPIKIEKTGSTIKVTRGNTVVATGTDATFTGGKVGFGTLNNPAIFDNLLVTTP